MVDVVAGEAEVELGKFRSRAQRQYHSLASLILAFFRFGQKVAHDEDAVPEQ